MALAARPMNSKCFLVRKHLLLPCTMFFFFALSQANPENALLHLNSYKIRLALWLEFSRHCPGRGGCIYLSQPHLSLLHPVSSQMCLIRREIPQDEHYARLFACIKLSSKQRLAGLSPPHHHHSSRNKIQKDW